MSLIKFTDGSIASFETSWVLPKNQPEPLDPALHVIGDKGSIIIEDIIINFKVSIILLRTNIFKSLRKIGIA